jgi:hypothetical protein
VFKSGYFYAIAEFFPFNFLFMLKIKMVDTNGQASQIKVGLGISELQFFE